LKYALTFSNAAAKEWPMSTDYAPFEKVTASALFDGSLEKFGVREHVKPDETSKNSRCLTDGRNFLWVYIDDAGLVTCLSRYGANAPGKILNAIAQAFDTDIFSEYEPQFWGFDTQEEWDAAMEQMGKESEEKFYVSVINYVRGQPNDILPGTIGACKADIAKKLVEEDPTLLAEEHKARFLDKMNSIYDRDHAVKITLTQEDIALATMLATHEDDLPSA
jgi:hypothetical protein